MPTPQNELTDIKVKENSLVDRAANRREFLVLKRDSEARRNGEWSGKINPILAADTELAALDKKDVEGTPVVAPPVAAEPSVSKDDSNAAAGGSAFSQDKDKSKVRVDMKKDESVDVAAQFAALVETAVKSGSGASAPVVVVAVSAPGATVMKTEPGADTVATAPETVAEKKADGADSTTAGDPAIKPDQTKDKKTVVKEDSQPLSLQPALRASLLAGVNAILAHAEAAKTILEATVSDMAGMSCLPWEAWMPIRMVDALADRLLGEEIGGVDFEADAILAGAAASGDVAKAGAVMAAHRLAKFTAAHGDMGSAFKAMQKCHKAMGDMLDEMKKPVEKTEVMETVGKAEVVPVVAPVLAPVSTPAPVAVVPATPSPEIAKAAKDIETIAKTVTDLQKTVVAQAALLEKARRPQQSNAISVEGSGTGNGTINSEVVWPQDMGANPDRRPGRF